MEIEGECSLEPPQSGNALQEVYVCVSAGECVGKAFSIVGVTLHESCFFSPRGAIGRAWGALRGGF